MTLKVIQRDVPCGSCTTCCQGDAIFIHPECGDVAADYLTEMYEGRLILKHRDNGDCIYLDRAKGCTIHDRQPVICREMDCRLVLSYLGEKRAKELGLSKLVTAAKTLMNRLAKEACV